MTIALQPVSDKKGAEESSSDVQCFSACQICRITQRRVVVSKSLHLRSLTYTDELNLINEYLNSGCKCHADLDIFKFKLKLPKDVTKDVQQYRE